MTKLIIVCGMTLLFAGCEAPMADTAVDHPGSSYVGTNGPVSATPAEHGTLDPSRNELNHQGVMEQNGGTAPSGTSGNQ